MDDFIQMGTVKGIIFYLLVILSQSKPVSTSCQGRDKPLLLTPYLEDNAIELARNLSRVQRSCVEEFVPDSYAGFLTTNKTLGNQMFFWFFPSSQRNAPVLLWLNGGPTVSSMIGLFWEHGPMSLNIAGSASGYSEREYSWTKSFSMLYVDNPVGVGLSYSLTPDAINNVTVTQKTYTDELVSFLHQFFAIYSEYKSNEFYIGGQSYAGKYVPALAYRIHSDIRTGASDVNLTGIYLGAPFFDPEIQSEAFYEFLYANGVVSHKQKQDAEQDVRKLFSQLKLKKTGIVSSDFDALVKYAPPQFLDNYLTGSVVNYSAISNVMNRDKLRKAVHAGDRLHQEIGINMQFYEAFGEDFLVSTKPEMAELMNNYKVLVYNGDMDVIVSSPTIEAALLSTPWTHQEQYNNSMRRQWHRGDEMIGFYSQTERFCRVVVHNSGHQVPHDVPDVAFLMMQQFIENGCVSDT